VLKISCLAISAACVSSPAAASPSAIAPLLDVAFTEDLGAADRIRAADRLSTLSQEISAATCFLHNDVAPDLNHELLSHSIAEFDLILDALANGSEELHIIGAETNRKTLAEIAAIKAEWQPLHAAAQTIVDDHANTPAMEVIYGQSEHLLETTSHLLSELEGEYSHPTQVLLTDVILIQFSGRQAMLTQKIAFEACLVWSGHGGDAQKDDLKVITERFDLIANALYDGMPDAGISAAPTEEIRGALAEVMSDWEDVSDYLDLMTAGGDVDAQDVEWISQVLTTKMKKMEAIVDLYTDFSRRAVL
jgi:hypothetical protein